MGRKCPQCKKNTLWETATGLKCSNPECSYQLITPANGGMGGKGKRCPACGKYQMFNGKCRNPECGAKKT